MRNLYSKDYIDSNCSKEYMAVYATDNTFGTLATDISISIFCLVATITLVLNKLWQSHAKLHFMTGFFVFLGSSHGISAVYHNLIDRTDHIFKIPLEYVFHSFSGLATACLCMIGIDFATNNRLIWIIFTFWMGAIIAAGVVLNDETVIGSFQVSIFVFMIITYCSHACIAVSSNESYKEMCWIICKIIAMLFLLVGLMTRIVFAPTCGTYAYRNCFETCFLPHPNVFNQNGLGNSLDLVGLILLLIAENQVPSIITSKTSKNNLPIPHEIEVNEHDLIIEDILEEDEPV